MALAAYGGTVDYDGETWSGTPVRTRGDYSGAELEVLLGRRWAGALPGYDVDLFAVLGYERMHRRLRDTVTPGGTRVIGYDETYRLPYLRAGLGFRHRLGRWRPWLRLGLRRPFAVRETVGDGIDVTLEPVGGLSLFMDLTLGRPPVEGRAGFEVRLFYDGLRLDPSPAAYSAGLGATVYQPESMRDVWGVTLYRRR